MPKDTYKYDFSRYAAAMGAARTAAAKQRSEEPVPDPPHREPAYGRIVTRSVGREKLPSDVKAEIEPGHRRFCLTCQGVMLGSGNPLKVLTPDGKVTDELYRFLDRQSLRKNAEIGCPLCRFVLEELRQRVADSDIGNEEDNDVGYDFGSFLGQSEKAGESYTLALLLYEYTEKGNNSVVLSLQNLAGQTHVLTSPSAEVNTTAAAVLAARIWLADCERRHSCKQLAVTSPAASQASRFLPKRLVNVGEDGEGIRLTTAEDVPSEHTYITLSHCWGDVTAHEAYSLTTARQEEYSQNIPLAVLPQTFLHACQVTRALGQRYIWIDSLCIVQDSKEDWSEQSAQMWQIYSNSYLNISATASTNPTEGLFRQRPEKAITPCYIFVGQNHPEFPAGNYRLYSESHWTRSVDNAPVNSRAWVLQERLLAPRILHFGQREVFWECQCLKASEAFPLGMPPLVDCRSPVLIKKEDVDEDDTPSKVPYYSLLKTWSSVVERYSSLHLTFPSDKLVALSALAQQVSLTYPAGGKYLAGLWEVPLIAELLWRSRAPGAARRAKEYRAPSWSWACIDGLVDANFDFSGYELYGTKSVSRPMLKILEASTVAANAGQPYGAVVSGELKVAGCMLKVRVKERRKPPNLERKTAQENKASFTKLMARVIPGYTGEEMQVRSNSVPETEHEEHLGIDVQNGILAIDGSSGWWDGDQYGPKLSAGDNVSLDVDLDTEDEMASLAGLDLFVLPVSCVSENNRPYNRESYEIHNMGCLVLAPEESVGGESVRRYRRVGMCNIENNTVSEFLCELGNQEEEEAPSEGTYQGSLPLEDFVPETWPCKELDFIPRSFRLVEVTIV